MATKVEKVEDLEQELGAKLSNAGKTNADLVNKAKEAMAEEDEKRKIEQTKKTLAKSEYEKSRILIENRHSRRKAENKNIYTKGYCEALEEYKSGSITKTEFEQKVRKLAEEEMDANRKSETTRNGDLNQLREDNPRGYEYYTYGY